MNRWPHQLYGVREALASIEQGVRRLCITTPTGGGKTLMMRDLIGYGQSKYMRVALYSNRKLLIEQTSGYLYRLGIEHGVRAAGWSDAGAGLDVQLCMVQTEGSRVFQRGKWELHDARLVLVDEAGRMTGNTMRTILEWHRNRGASIIGFDATPLGLTGLYDRLITAGTTSDLRACGALVLAKHYGCTEPDLKLIGRMRAGVDPTERQNRKAIMVNGIFGHVFEWFERLNPDHKPSILFAPGVAESLWFARQFYARGISVAHLDGDNVWVNGVEKRSSREARQEVLDSSRDGKITVLCNRFVLREGIDAPWLAHGILCTVFGSVASYLQSGGRLLRAYPGLAHVVIQDHAGNWWRFGSLNDDRHWELGDSAELIAQRREAAMHAGAPQPIRCPRCTAILRAPHCNCGWEARGSLRSRPVLMADGTLHEMPGDPYQPRRTEQRLDAAKLWARVYYRARNSRKRMNFNQAYGLFFREHGYWPDKNLPLMPISAMDWYRPVAEVPMDRLIPKPGATRPVDATRTEDLQETHSMAREQPARKR